MKTNVYSLSLTVAVSAIVGSCSQSGKQPQRPNIIFIMSDDHAMAAVSCYNGKLNQTPNIDRIAAEGVRFTNATVTNSISAPSRAVLLTGKHSHINGKIDNLKPFDHTQQTFPKLLQQAGYQTAMIGKLHLKGEPEGFDYSSILPGQGAYYNPDFIENGKKVRYEGYCTDIITEKTLNWLTEQRDSTKPFCLFMHHKAPHRNWMPAPRHIGKFKDTKFPIPATLFDDYKGRGAAAREQELEIAMMYAGYDLKLMKEKGSAEIFANWDGWFKRLNPEQQKIWMAYYQERNDKFYETERTDKELLEWMYQSYMEDYLGTIEAVDESVGEVLKYLDESGLAENTIIVYTSDQGFYLGEHGWFDKRFMYKESFGTPLVMRYPQAVKKGWTSDEMVQNLDFAQTFLDYAGVEAPADMQGQSMRSVLEQKTETPFREAAYYHYYEYPSEHAVKRHYGIATKRYKLIHFYYDIDQWELYDLQTDPSELNNLFGKPEMKDITTELKGKLDGLRKQYKVPSIEEELKNIDELNARRDKRKKRGKSALFDLTKK